MHIDTHKAYYILPTQGQEHSFFGYFSFKITGVSRAENRPGHAYVWFFRKFSTVTQFCSDNSAKKNPPSPCGIAHRWSRFHSCHPGLDMSVACPLKSFAPTFAFFATLMLIGHWDQPGVLRGWLSAKQWSKRWKPSISIVRHTAGDC